MAECATFCVRRRQKQNFDDKNSYQIRKDKGGGKIKIKINLVKIKQNVYKN